MMWNRVYDLYEVRAKTRSHHAWVVLGKREPKWVRKSVQPKWWQFWKERCEPREPDDLLYLEDIYAAACRDSNFVEVEYVGYVSIDEQSGSYLHPVILRNNRNINIVDGDDDSWRPPNKPR